MFGIVVVVLHDHKHIATLDLLLGREVVAAYALVVSVCALVGACDNYRLIRAIAVVAVLQRLEQLATVDALKVGVGAVEVGYLVDAVFEHTAYHRGVEKDARIGSLAHHLVHRSILHLAIV